MPTCNHNHQLIAYSIGRERCPLCAALAEIESYRKLEGEAFKATLEDRIAVESAVSEIKHVKFNGIQPS